MRNIAGVLLVLCLLQGAGGQTQEPAAVPDATAVLATEPASQPETVRVVMATALGDIVLAIETARAPVTAANFLRYVDQKRLDGVNFYRAMKLDEAGNYGLIQAGPRGDPKRVLKPVAHEPTTATGLSHVSGAISMARTTPGSATADFFIVVGDLPALDAKPQAEPAQGDTLGYAVFGRVIEGMEVVKQIMEQPRSATAGEGAMKGQMLEPVIRLNTAKRAE